MKFFQRIRVFTYTFLITSLVWSLLISAVISDYNKILADSEVTLKRQQKLLNESQFISTFQSEIISYTISRCVSEEIFVLRSQKYRCSSVLEL